LHKLQLQQASLAICKLALQFTPLLRARQVASYAAYSGEIDPGYLEQGLQANIYHPRISNLRLGLMQFHSRAGRARQRNKLGMTEPTAIHPAIDPRQLDIVLMPLVAFQRDGTRLGQGGGFYDRAFAFRNNPQRIKKPLLVGLAHHFQETQGLDREPWDVPADVIITDQEIIIAQP
jgi:5-formyltetrahydrofolate cyclo-ligase